MQPVNRSVKRLARIAGALYLVNIVAGAFAIGYVSSVAPTIQANEALFRAGIAAHLIVTLTNPPLTLIFYELFKIVNRRLALLAAFFSLVATGIEGASLFVQVEHPVLPAYDVYAVFFGFGLMTTGYLVTRSNFLPRAIGVLLVVDGISYVLYSFVDILGPDFILYASDYPHWDGNWPESTKPLRERKDITEAVRAKIAGGNARRFYGI